MQSPVNMQWISALRNIAIVIVCYCIQLTQCKLLDPLYWNVSNPIFRIDATDNIIDINVGNAKFEYDQINLICPSYPEGTKEEDAEAYIIYNVSKEEYDTCSIHSNARIIAKCDTPTLLKYFTITFRPFTPQPGGLEFFPGQDYYFITASEGNIRRINNTHGGRCKSKHMKVTFKVCCGDNMHSSSSSSSNNNNQQQQQQQQKHVKQSTLLSSSSSSPFSSLPASLNVSNTVNSNSSLMPSYISPYASGSPGIVAATPVPMQSSEPNRVLAYITSTVEPFKSDFRIPSYPSTLDVMHFPPPPPPPPPPSPPASQSPGNVNTRSSSSHSPHNSHPSRINGHNSGHNIFNVNSNSGSSTRRHPSETITSDAARSPSWWKPKSSFKPPLDPFNTSGDWPDKPGASHPSGAPPAHRKGRAWLLIVAAGIAVGVACLIVCFLGVGRRLFIREKHKQSTVINYSV